MEKLSLQGIFMVTEMALALAVGKAQAADTVILVQPPVSNGRDLALVLPNVTQRE